MPGKTRTTANTKAKGGGLVAAKMGGGRRNGRRRKAPVVVTSSDDEEEDGEFESDSDSGEGDFFRPPPSFCLHNKWTIVDKIVTGTFGRLFKVAPAIAKKNTRGKKRNKKNKNKRANANAVVPDVEPVTYAVAKVFDADAELDAVALEASMMTKFTDDSNLLHAFGPAKTFRYDGLTHHYFVMPSMTMDLRRLFDEVIPRPFTSQEARWVACQILAGMEQLHAHGIAHCDLKPSNIMVECEYDLLNEYGTVAKPDDGSPAAMPIISSVKLCDFGTAVVVDDFDHDALTKEGTTLGYSAPEVVTACAECVGIKSDVFSFGCIYYELLSLQPLFPIFLHRDDSVRGFLAELKNLHSSRASNGHDNDRRYPPAMRASRRYFTAFGDVCDGFDSLMSSTQWFSSLAVTAGDRECIASCVELDGDRRPSVKSLQETFKLSAVVEVIVQPGNGAEKIDEEVNTALTPADGV
jgi:serine/threonine protein kinase